MKVIWRSTLLLVAVLGPVHSLCAQEEIRKERISFERGKSQATIEGVIAGHDSVDYLVGARAGRGTRILYFLEGKWSTDSEATVVVDDEAYEIPDAVIFGG